jgi:hypothetical protein
MRGTVRGILAAMVLTVMAASAAATHTSPPPKPERPPAQPSSVQQEPEKRQNFRARRADEIPPWEGFEDCPMAFPCVGAVNRY